MADPDLHVNLDLDRLRRCGSPEVVYGAGKTDAETVTAATRLVEAHGRALVTRARASALAALAAALPEGRIWERGGCFALGSARPEAGPVGVISAGTSDATVAEEAVATLTFRGVEVRSAYDCGVAGLHRLLDRLGDFADCEVLVAVAGMDAALPTVLGGLVDKPVIAVPTSVGYGVAAGGQAALNAVLASCAAGLLVVNIDNGFGAGHAAATIARRIAGVAESDSR